MTSFEQLYSTILNKQIVENQGVVTTTTPQTPTTNASSNQQGDEQLLKLLQQKLNDQKFKDALMKMLNSNEPQKPAPTPTSAPATTNKPQTPTTVAAQ